MQGLTAQRPILLLLLMLMAASVTVCEIAGRSVARSHRHYSHLSHAALFGQVYRDLAHFETRGGISRADLNNMSTMPGLARVAIISGKLYAELPKDYAGTAAASLLMVDRAIRGSHTVHDVEFYLNLGDHCRNNGLPVMSWSKHVAATDILYPYWSWLWLPKLSGDSVEATSWENKTSLAFWRGSSTGARPPGASWRTLTRVRLVTLCRQRPDLCSAELTGLYQVSEKEKDEMMKELGTHKRTTMADSFAYRYIIVVDGNSAPSSRLLDILSSGSLMLWQEAPDFEFYYPSLRPWVHYVPLSLQLEDLHNKIEWVKAHDTAARAIAERALEWYRMTAQSSVTDAYWRQLLTGYARLQTFVPSAEGLQHVWLNQDVNNVVVNSMLTKGAGADSQDSATDNSHNHNNINNNNDINNDGNSNGHDASDVDNTVDVDKATKTATSAHSPPPHTPAWRSHGAVLRKQRNLHHPAAAAAAATAGRTRGSLSR